MNQQIARKLRKQGHEFVTGEVASGEFGGSDKTVKSVLDKPFFAWFWEVVLGNSSEEYRREFYRELHCGHTIGPSPISFGSPDFRSSSLPYVRVIENDLLFRLAFLTVPGSLVWLLRHVLSGVIRKLRRPSYYERERERRIMLGITRRSIRKRKTVNREPTVEEIRAAWNGARHSPEGALRLGGMLEDLECYVNNLTIGNEVDGYRGRRGGIKRHLQAKAPDLFEHYAALMRYKSIARKFRQACDIEDPNPADALLPMSSPPRLQQQLTNWSEQIKQSQDRASASVDKIADKSSDVETVTAGPEEKRSEQIKRNQCSEDSRGNVTDEVGQSGDGSNWSEQIKRSQDEEGGQDNVPNEAGWGREGANCSELIKRGQDTQDGEAPVQQKEIVVQHGVKSWVLDGFVFAWREDCWIRRESYETAIRVLRACENSVISLEAAIALEIDPNFVTSEAVKRYAVKAETTTKRFKKIETQTADGRIGPNKSSDGLGGELKVGGKADEQTGPNKSSDLKSGDSEGGDSTRRGKVTDRVIPARIVGWLRRRNCVAL